eukprot:10789515-Alexandrium_andersonii.AAC.1
MVYDTRKEFARAMSSEWQSFQNFDALRPLSQEEREYMAEHSVKPVKMRWVFTDKHERLRVAKPSLPLKAKARLV